MRTLTKISLTVLISLFMITIIVTLLVNHKKNETEFTYDISEFKEVEVSDVLDMFESGKTYVVMVGYDECEACASIIPSLKEAQKENNYITQYLDIKSVERKSTNEDWVSLVNKLNMTTTREIEGEEVEETYGYFLHYYGYTPTIIIIKDGKQTGGHIGEADKDELLYWIHDKVN